MNRYRHTFTVECPNNGAAIRYRLTIETDDVIMVEDIVEACRVGPTFHEALADALHRRFRGWQTMRAHHHGVTIETERGDA